MFENLQDFWGTFWYNFTWDDYTGLLNGQASKAALFVPLIGYAVLFNDFVVANLTFENLVGSSETSIFIKEGSRMRWVFLGFVSLALSNLAYKVWRPNVIKLGETRREYVKFYMENASATDFLLLHWAHRETDTGPYTEGGKYNDKVWGKFWSEATWEDPDYDPSLESPIAYENMNFADAKRKHQSLLFDLLAETYFRECKKRPKRLFLCCAIALLGYSLILIPSFDLCGRVLQLIFF